jgi:hypothetical protein
MDNVKTSAIVGGDMATKVMSEEKEHYDLFFIGPIARRRAAGMGQYTFDTSSQLL